MAQINLLPWRDALRRERQREFGFMVVGGIVIACLLIGYWYIHNDSQIKFQKKRNALLQDEIAKVEKKIKEIKALERTRAQLLARMNVIQNLQGSRPQIVHLMDELVTTIPDGTLLTSVTQSGPVIRLEGRAQSNARVSSYMRNIDESPWLGGADLKIIQDNAKRKTADGMSDFRLLARQVVPKKGAPK